MLREARQPRVVGGRVEGHRPRRRSTPRATSRWRTTSGSWWRRRSTGREIELGVLGDDPPAVSVPGEIVPGDDFYSYADKYEADDAELLVPAPLTDDEVPEAQALACRAFEACRCEAMARVDLFLADGTARFLVNEVNTIPGLHADLDVPAALGGDGRAVRGAPRPPHRPGRRPPRRRGAPPAAVRSAAAVASTRDARVDAMGWSEVDDGAGEGAGDAVDRLDLGDDELAQVVERVGLGAARSRRRVRRRCRRSPRRRCHAPPWRPSPRVPTSVWISTYAVTLIVNPLHR